VKAIKLGTSVVVEVQGGAVSHRLYMFRNVSFI